MSTRTQVSKCEKRDWPLREGCTPELWKIGCSFRMRVRKFLSSRHRFRFISKKALQFISPVEAAHFLLFVLGS